MKKFLLILLVLALILPAAACAEDEKEDEGVQVFPGVWKIGVDIPAGEWTITPFSVDPRMHDVYILYCSALNEAGTEGDLSKSEVWSPNRITFESFQEENMLPTFLNINCVEGRYIIIKDGIVTFKPYEGNPDLGFN